MAAPDYNLTGGPDGLFQSHDLSAQILSKTVDFSKYTGTAAGAATKTADVITIPAGFVVDTSWHFFFFFFGIQWLLHSFN